MILLISPLPPPLGGIATWTEHYLRWANENGLSVQLVNNGVRGKWEGDRYKRSGRLGEFVRTVLIISQTAFNIAKTRPKCVHLNTSCGTKGIIRDYICARLVKLCRLKLVVHYHCNIEDQIKYGSLQWRTLRKLAKGADVNLVLNSSSSRYLLKNFQAKSFKVPNFVDESWCIQKEKKISKDIETIVYVGHVRMEKGVGEIIETARINPEIKFLMIGPVFEDINKVGAVHNVVYLGPRSKNEIIHSLDKADVFIFPSYSEGFSVALLEAMGRGVPIIATEVGAAKDLLGDDGGVLVQPKSTADLNDAIKLLASEALRMKMSKANAEKIARQYTPEKVLPELIKYYL